jgi:hypothetical protein
MVLTKLEWIEVIHSTLLNFYKVLMKSLAQPAIGFCSQDQKIYKVMIMEYSTSKVTLEMKNAISIHG